MHGQRIAVALSGGVDSSVAALLLQRQGHELIGLTLKLYDLPAGAAAGQGCCSPADIAEARQVAEQLGIRFYVINAREEFERRVIDPFVAAYRSGRTPSPCLVCNQHFKFDLLLQRAQAAGAAALATGHYARRQLHPADGQVRLYRSRNRDKDQSYFLARLNQEQLRRALFPVGELAKEEVRALARQAGLPVSEKKESQEICFVGRGGLPQFLAERAGSGGEGPLIHLRQGEIGRHQGVHLFTVGQRQGVKVAWREPLYVVALDPQRRIVYVGEAPDLQTTRFQVNGLHWIDDEALTHQGNDLLTVKVRSRSPDAVCRIEDLGQGRATVILSQPLRAVAPGQAAVFYRGQEVLGSGWIESFQPEQPWPMYR